MLAALGRGLASLGPDGGRFIKSGPMAMVYRAFHTTKESRQELQPLVSASGQVLCWDGRLDNREDLIPVLGELLRGDFTDAGIVMAARLRKAGNGKAQHQQHRKSHSKKRVYSIRSHNFYSEGQSV